MKRESLLLGAIFCMGCSGLAFNPGSLRGPCDRLNPACFDPAIQTTASPLDFVGGQRRAAGYAARAALRVREYREYLVWIAKDLPRALGSIRASVNPITQEYKQILAIDLKGTSRAELQSLLRTLRRQLSEIPDFEAYALKYDRYYRTNEFSRIIRELRTGLQDAIVKVQAELGRGTTLMQ